MKTYTITISIPNDYNSEDDYKAMLFNVDDNIETAYEMMAEGAKSAGLEFVSETDYGAKWRGTAEQIHNAQCRAPRWAYFGTGFADDTGDELWPWI